MVVIGSIKVDLKNLSINGSKEVLRTYKLSIKNPRHDGPLVYYDQKDINKLELAGYAHDSDVKLEDCVWVSLYINTDNEENEPSKRDIMANLKSPQCNTNKSPRRATATARNPASLKSPRKKASKAASKASPKANPKSPRKSTSRADRDDGR